MPAALKSYTAPVRGWNARDQIDQIENEQASRLENLFPRPNSVAIRGGTTVFSRGVTGAVETIAEFASRGARTMIAAGGGTIMSVSSAGVASTLATGYTSDRHQTVMFNEHLLGVNGADAPWQYDGSSFAANSVSGSGLTAADLIGIAVHRQRVYRWEAARPWFWYGDTNAIAGTLTKFDLSRIGRRGGNLVAMASWNRDAGNGIDDLAVFFMSTGDCIVYQGGDPGDASDWSLLGVFPLAPPIDRRAVVKLGADVVLVTRDGILSLETVLPLGGTKRYAALSDGISGAFLEAVRNYGAVEGWQLAHYPAASMLLCNVPVSMPAVGQPESFQLAMNTDTGAWAKFTGMSARCMGLWNDRLFIGTIEEGADWDAAIWDESPWESGLIAEVDRGFSDLGIDAAGNAVAADIVATLRTKYYDFGRDTAKKRFTLARFNIESAGALGYRYGLSVDYDTSPTTLYGPINISVGGGDWDTADWDTAEWGGGTSVDTYWRALVGIGYTAALTLEVRSQAETAVLRGIDMMFEKGGVL